MFKEHHFSFGGHTFFNYPNFWWLILLLKKFSMGKTYNLRWGKQTSIVDLLLLNTSHLSSTDNLVQERERYRDAEGRFISTFVFVFSHWEKVTPRNKVMCPICLSPHFQTIFTFD